MEKNSLYFKFKYEKQDEELINGLEEKLIQNSERIFNFFDPELERKPLEIEIFPTKKAFDESKKQRQHVDEVPKWVVGCCLGDRIEYVSFNDYQNTSHAFNEENYDKELELYKKTLLHEFTHYVVYLYSVKHKEKEVYPLRYLNDGIAQYLSEQEEQSLDFNYSLEDILNSNNCYPGWLLMVKYILENYGRTYFLQLVDDNDLALSETPRLFEEAKVYYDGLKQESHKSR